ncbi:alpha/beta hydrolase [Propionivibrio limicola]|uniref:alpha/beta hydrolase n=1 Tax=Propionivibrio limicola TaxID=167645 RepID=UPI001292828C|nr:alpha/beta hydrolase [Propionivibrio limicola]
MKPSESIHFIAGPAGRIETIIEAPEAPCGIALIAHPHPLFGGTHTNKVVHTLARTFTRLNYIALRPNFRGVGASEGTHDDGRGETDDLLAVLDEARHSFGELPVVLAGFSFGAYVQTRVAEALAAAGEPAQRLVLVGTAAGYIEGARNYVTRAVASDTLIIHGSADETVPLANVLAWAEPLELPVVVIPGADHFFHRRLHLLRDIILRTWHDHAV